MTRERGHRARWGFVGPTLVFLVVFNVFPLVYNVALGFTNARITSASHESVGTENYERVFSEPAFAAAIRTTALFVALAVSIELLLGFGLALALKKVIGRRSGLLTLLLVPMMLSPAVMGLFWNLVLNGDYGILNQVLRAVGLPQPEWLTDPDLKFVSVLLIDVWMWTPFMMLIALAGLNAIPESIYEAAEIDRAGPWTVFRRITLPMSAPLLLLAVLFRATDALKQFDLVMAITGPNDASTQTLSALLYQVMNPGRAGKLGLGSAYACVILVLVMALASLFVRYLDWIQARQGRSSP